jgi:N-acetylglucosamine-6-phosphate deacetylase
LIVKDNVLQEIIDCDKPENFVIATSFIDAQAYGANGFLFSEYKNVQALNELYNYCLANGTTHFIPTVATNTYETIFACIDAVQLYWQQGSKGCLGLHVEGPWINEGKRGAHVKELIHAPSLQQVKDLFGYAKGAIKMLTIAPEIISEEVLNFLLTQDVILSIGHSNANYKQATSFLNKGNHLATHLYNAMSGLQHRNPGLVGAVLNHPTAMASLVADGIHVNFEAIEIAYKIMSNRLFAITDAVTNCTTGYYQHQLVGNKYESSGILSGSALTMHKAFLNLHQHCNIDVANALAICSTNVANALQLFPKIGAIKIGENFNAIVLNEDWSLKRIFS